MPTVDFGKSHWHQNLSCKPHLSYHMLASRSLSETERHYAQTEKEAFAITWALEKFCEHVLGKIIHIETDHKPLIPLLGQKT